MKKIFFIVLIFSGFFMVSCDPKKDNPPVVVPKDTIPNPPVVDPSYNINIQDMKMRDPFVFVDTISKSYFIHVNTGDNQTFTAYQSKDLKKWKKLGKSFIAPTDFWGKLDFWAPDNFEYKGMYYMIATFSSSTITRGCGILVSYLPEGPYAPLVNNPITPSGWSCCDGTLYIDNGEPYLLFGSTQYQFGLGYVYIQKLSNDLKTTVGDPILITKAADAPWVTKITSNGISGYVGDAPFIYKTAENELIMVWSSFAKNTGYSIGVARSPSGSILGPWVHDPTPLNVDGGGHAMIFKSLDGKTKISYHSPNAYPNYLKIYGLDIFKGAITIVN